MGSQKELFQKGLTHVITFGKHKDKTLKEICKEDPEYIVWATSNTNLKIKDEVKKEAIKYGASFF